MSLYRPIWPFPIKKNYIMMGIVDGWYRKCNSAVNKSIELIYTALTDHDTDAQWLLRELLNPEAEVVSAELVEVLIDKNKVILQFTELICDDPEEYVGEFDRNELINLVQEWRELVTKKVAPIYIYYNDRKYGVTDILPEGVE